MQQILIEILYFIIIFLSYAFLISYYKTRNSKINLPFMVFLAFYHILFQLFFWNYSLTHIGDSNMYYETSHTNYGQLSEKWIENFGVGTKFIQFITFPLSNVNYLNLSYFQTYFFFGLLGYAGMLILLDYVIQHFYDFKNYIYLILLMPNFNFWTVAIGKDSTFFLLFMLLVASLSKIRKNYLAIALFILLIGLIRAHIALCILIAFAITFLLKNQSISSIGKFLIFISLGGIIYAVLQFIINYVLQINAEDLIQYLEGREALNQGGGSSIDISNYGIILRLFTFLFRPFFFDAKDILWLVSSFENLFYLIFTFNIINFSFPKYIFKSDFKYLFLFSYFLITAILLSYTIANLGLAIRQKTMVLPALFLVIFSFLVSKEEVIAKVKYENN